METRLMTIATRFEKGFDGYMEPAEHGDWVHFGEYITLYHQLQKVKALRDEWAKDADEHLNTWGQHLPCSVTTLVEMLDEILNEEVE
jgi:hypothetical protein